MAAAILMSSMWGGRSAALRDAEAAGSRCVLAAREGVALRFIGARPRPPVSGERALLAACLGERMDQRARFELWRVQDGGLARLTELIEIRPLNVPILDVEDAGLLPFAERTELDVSDHRLELRLVQVVCQLALVDAADRIDGLSQ